MIRHTGCVDDAEELVVELGRAYRRAFESCQTITAAQWQAAVNVHQKRVRQSSDVAAAAKVIAMIPHAIMDAMDPATIAKQCPPFELAFSIASGNVLRAHWSRLHSTTLEGHEVYSWPDRPRIHARGGAWKLALSRHAIIQLLDRFEVTSNSGKLTTTRIISECKFEPSDDQAGLWAWTPCYEGSLIGLIASQLSNGDDVEQYQFRLAYSPIRFEGSFAVCKTTMLPAMLVSGINDALISPKLLTENSDRSWDELKRLHERLPLIRRAETSQE